ncbi:hypothetical protein DOY81_008522 [Sarcophaga bullata]|nr:hypothetical protein DOY81_008522 [Sarcophaga bullata]
MMNCLPKTGDKLALGRGLQVTCFRSSYIKQGHRESCHILLRRNNAICEHVLGTVARNLQVFQVGVYQNLNTIDCSNNKRKQFYDQ